MKQRHGSVICRGAFCEGMGCILHHPLCGWFPFFCGSRQGVAAKPPPVTISCPPDTRRWTEAVCPLSDRPLLPPLMNLYRFQRWQVAAALSAAVTTTKPIGNQPQLAWAHKPGGRTKPIPSYSSGGGPGEGLLLEKPPPPEFPQPLRFFGREREGGDFSEEKSSSSHMYPLS